ncbi:MAG TPA: branched-chain amino acid ABC transporter permease [Clostridia bacterium]|nr:branched-chain amino acid ABC transporter permease [Clostridia bacterium]
MKNQVKSLNKNRGPLNLKYQTMLLLTVPLIVLGLIVALTGRSLFINIFTAFCINLVMVTGLQVFMGNSGILNWSHIGFMGIGAYASAIFSTSSVTKNLAAPNLYPFLNRVQIPVIPAILLGGLIAAIVAAVIAWPLMRLSDAVGVITIYATLIVMHVILTQWDNITNGPRTFFGVEAYTTIWIALISAVLIICFALFFKNSALGLKLRASRDDRYAAASIGISVVRVRYFTFVISAFLAGFGGGIWAHFITSFSPKSFYITDFFTLLTMLVIGGASSVSGAVAGTTIVTVTRELLRQVESVLSNMETGRLEFFGLTEIILAIFMISVLVFNPDGIARGRELTFPRPKRRKGTLSEKK